MADILYYLRTTTLLRYAALAAIVSLLAGCAGLPGGMQAPTVTLADLALGGGGLFEQQFNLKLRIQNPNPEPFHVDGIAFELELNDQPFAKGVGNQPLTVPRYGSELMDVEGVSTLSTLLRQVARLATENPALKYRIKGSLSVDGGTRIPFDRRGELDLASALRKSR